MHGLKPKKYRCTSKCISKILWYFRGKFMAKVWAAINWSVILTIMLGIGFVSGHSHWGWECHQGRQVWVWFGIACLDGNEWMIFSINSISYLKFFISLIYKGRYERTTMSEMLTLVWHLSTGKWENIFFGI